MKDPYEQRAIERARLEIERWRLEAEKRPGVMIQAAATERTCSTCSKTCDVGVKCWWCGNE
jgi:hypothetical protein